MPAFEYEELKKSYRKTFLAIVSEISDEVENLRPVNFVGDIFETFEINSDGFKWQQSVISFLKEKVQQDKLSWLNDIKLYRTHCNCVGCGDCCKFAVSEFSYDELKFKAKNGDNFASQFVSVFVPYENLDEVYDIYPEYIQMLEEKSDGNFYFYHCPKVTNDNKCPDYDNRPQICRDFPDNPLAFLPKFCGFKDWKLKSEPVSLKLKAEVEIINFYISKIKDLY